MLSISGYHMAVVAGIVFFFIRAGLALLPVAREPPSDQEMGGARSRSSRPRFILLLSGAEVATQRSFIMIAIVLIGVMLDRPALTFRTLTVAALCVLLLAPEVGGASELPDVLCGDARADRRLPTRPAVGTPTPTRSLGARIALWGGREIAGLVLASLVAGLATTPYAAYHFHRLAPYGVLANLLAMPVVSAEVMPMGILGLIAMPFGFDGIFWQAMGWGHRLDDRGRALGRAFAGRGRPHPGIRHRPAAALHRRPAVDLPVAHAAALERRAAGILCLRSGR